MDNVKVNEPRSEVPDWASSMAPPGTSGGMSGPKITDKQRGYLLDLISKKQIKPEQEGRLDLVMKCLRISEDPEEYGMSKSKASELIEWFLRQPNKARTQTVTPNDNWPNVPAGRYAVLNPDGSGRLMFYSVDRPTEGRWAGYLFLNVWASDERHPIRNKDSKDKILAQIALDPKAAAEKFGQEIGKCGICGRTLTDETSRQIGIGPVCRGKSEWY